MVPSSIKFETIQTVAPEHSEFFAISKFLESVVRFLFDDSN